MPQTAAYLWTLDLNLLGMMQKSSADSIGTIEYVTYAKFTEQNL